MSHGDEALELPAGFQLTAKTANAVAGIAEPERRIWAVQFHPEVHHTPQGTAAAAELSSFDICGAKADWTPAHFIESTVAAIREQGWRRTRDLRAVGRRGFVGGGGAGARARSAIG